MATQLTLPIFGIINEPTSEPALVLTGEPATAEPSITTEPAATPYAEVNLEPMAPAEVPADFRQARWNQLLHEAIRQPGMLHNCYRKFYQYSIGNLMLAVWQLQARGLEFGPLATFSQWKSKHNRFVKKGEKAIAMWQPMTVNAREKDDEGNEVTTDRKRVIFVAKAQWFALSQTDGEELPEAEAPDWDIDQALTGLNIKRVEFDFLGMGVGVNCQGYAYNRNIAINPACEKKLATSLHEIAHIVLGHTEKDTMIADDKVIARSIRELEAESTAMLCLDALGFTEFAVYNRGYIQHWMQAGGVTEVPEDSAKRIFSAADKILKAGQLKKANDKEQAA